MKRKLQRKTFAEGNKNNETIQVKRLNTAMDMAENANKNSAKLQRIVNECNGSSYRIK